LADSGYQLKRDHQQSSNLHFYLARCDLLENRKANAIQHLHLGIAESPGDPWLLSYLIALTDDASYQKQLFRYFDDIDAQFFLGKAYLQTAQPAKAAECFRSVVAWIPEFRRAYVDLAASLGESGDHASAEIVYRKAIGLSPDPVFHEEQILSVFQTIATTQDTPFAHYSYGIVLRQFGHYEAALREQEIAGKDQKLNAEAQQEILMLKRVLQKQKP
jgi:tetratricopeptide (TPR) repeat protein